MKRQHYRKLSWLGTGLAVAPLLAGCSLAILGGAVAVGTVGLVGYSVYEGGSSVATGVSNLASGDSKPTIKAGETVVFSGKEFTTECAGTVAEVWRAGQLAFTRANLQDIGGNFDFFSGQLTAWTWEKTQVTLQLKNTGTNKTTLAIQIGNQGDLKDSQSLYILIHEELEKITAARTPAAQKNIAP